MAIASLLLDTTTQAIHLTLEHRMSREDRSKLRLMVVDDELHNLDLLYRTFRREFQVYKASSGVEALQVLDEVGEMAIIISDQRMPGMNGTELLSKTVAQYPDTIRIVLTGYTDVEDLVEAINSGKVFKYITKPWDSDQLKMTVQQAAETYQVIKQRTDELRRSLRRESIFNAVNTAIRESLDYHNMLQTIVETLGRIFEAEQGILYPVEDDHFVSPTYSFPSQSPEFADPPPGREPGAIAQKVLETQTTHRFTQTETSTQDQLAVPLIYQQALLAVLVLGHQGDRVWSDEDLQLLEEVAGQAALAISQAILYRRTQEQTQQMRAELAVARQIQSNLLRQSWPDLDSVNIQASCYPAREVGGDFFEVYIHPQGDIWLAVGDVSGKGVPAALFMASSISVMRRELAQEISPEPDLVMQNLNSILSEDLVSNNCFITMVLARYTPETRQLVYANAGHIYPMVWSHKAVTQQRSAGEITVEPNYLKVRGVPLGILPIWKAPSGSLVLSQGEILLLISDGITEVTVNNSNGRSNQPHGTMLQQAGLWHLLTQEESPFELNHLLSRIREHNQIQEDDQTILSLEVL